MAASSSSSSSSSSMGSSLALAAATAMALSGSLVIFSLCRTAKPAAADDASSPPPSSSSSEPALRPCLSSSEKRRRGRKARRKGEKRVHFAEDVVDNEPTCRGAVEAEAERMPANREALYRGMLRDRSMHRVACSYSVA